MGFLNILVKEVINNPTYKGNYGEKLVYNYLKKYILINKDSKYLNNVYLLDSKNKSHEIDGILILNKGIFVLEIKNYSGLILGDKNSPYRIMCSRKSKYRIINSYKQNLNHSLLVSKVLSSDKVYSLIIFIKNNANTLKIKNVINLNDLKKYLDEFNHPLNLDKEEIDKIYENLNKIKVNLSKKEHIKNIKKDK